MHKNAFGVVHISKRDVKYKNEAIGGATGGVIGVGAAGTANKGLKNWANREIHAPMSTSAAEAIMNGGDTGVTEAKKSVARTQMAARLREFKGKKSIIPAGVAGAGIGAYAGHKFIKRKKKS